MPAESDIRQLLKAIVEKLEGEYAPEQIILFGSYAYGEPTAESDIDLLIVKDTAEPPIRRRIAVRRMVSPLRTGYAFSSLVVTPEELRHRLEIGDPFFEEIIRKGEVLYAS